VVHNRSIYLLSNINNPYISRLQDLVYAFSFYCSIKLFKNICDPVLRAVVSKGEGASSPCNCLCLMRMIDIVAQLCVERIVVVGIKHDEMYSIA
jgi:hypothetical protein